MRPTLKYILLTLAFGALASGCIGREVSEVTPNQARENLKPVPVSANRDIDLLFVVDNSISMGEEQTSLVANFPRFINVLETIEGGLPNVRIGVVSTDVGTGSQAVGGCSNSTNSTGDNGVLLTSGCSQLGTNRFIEDVESTTTPGERIRNYSGTLAEAFGCIAELGTGGCGFEQPLESARRALDPNGPNAAQVANFVRDGAFLAIIFITDEDDCSAESDTLFSDPDQTEADPLGPLDSFRCFEFGVTCDQAPRVRGEKSSCVPDNDSDLLTPVSEYIEFFRGLKPDPTDVIVAGIIGNTDPVVVRDNVRRNNIPQLAPSCVLSVNDGVEEGAAPGIRLNAFFEGFPQRQTVQTICEQDLSGALIQIAELLRLVVGNPCLEGNIQTDPLECQVSDVENFNTDNPIETILPQCDNDADPEQSTNQPCWSIFEDRDACADFPSGLTIQVYPVNRQVEGDVTTVVRCVSN